MREAYSEEVSSCGYWPGGAEEGAFYAYAYPEPPGYQLAAHLPAEAHYDQALGEFLLPYAAVRQAEDPDAYLLSFLEATHAAAAGLGHWPATVAPVHDHSDEPLPAVVPLARHVALPRSHQAD
jgi:hypothetical protein